MKGYEDAIVGDRQTTLGVFKKCRGLAGFFAGHNFHAIQAAPETTAARCCRCGVTVSAPILERDEIIPPKPERDTTHSVQPSPSDEPEFDAGVDGGRAI